MIDGIPDDVYAFQRKPLTPEEAETFGRYLEKQTAPAIERIHKAAQEVRNEKEN